MLRKFFDLQVKLILFQFKYLILVSLSFSTQSFTKIMNKIACKPMVSRKWLVIYVCYAYRQEILSNSILLYNDEYVQQRMRQYLWEIECIR